MALFVNQVMPNPFDFVYSQSCPTADSLPHKPVVHNIVEPGDNDSWVAQRYSFYLFRISAALYHAALVINGLHIEGGTSQDVRYLSGVIPKFRLVGKKGLTH